ncbi:MAG: sulfur carrier protein ThiS [Jiangellaceae bacterium]
MKVLVNGVPSDIAEGTTVAELVDARAEQQRWVAVAVDGDVVPRGTWTARMLGDGDSVEVLVPVAGG